MSSFREPEEIRVVLFGCQKIASDVIDIIRMQSPIYGSSEHGLAPRLVGVVTHDEDRDAMFDSKSVAQHCDSLGIPNVRFNGKVDPEVISAWNPDIIFSIYYRKILSKEIIDLPKMGCINIHPAGLPQNRGPNPTYWMVRRGDVLAFTTIHYIDEGMDTGDIIDMSPGYPIIGMTGFQVNEMMMSAGVRLFADNFLKILAGKNARTKQDHSFATCNVQFTGNMRYIDWNERAESILCHIRAHAKPYAGSIARTKGGKEILVHKAHVLDVCRASGGPGTYNYIEDEGLVVQTHDRPILITDYDGPHLSSGRFITGVP